jgi:AICAR transformylase/IMP cyclohydrolase PurH
LNESSLDTERRSRPVRGGALEQANYTFVQNLSAEHIQQHGEVTDQQERDMILAWAVGNTITLVKDGKLIGNGVGQQDRVGSGQLALTRTTTGI